MAAKKAAPHKKGVSKAKKIPATKETKPAPKVQKIAKKATKVNIEGLIKSQTEELLDKLGFKASVTISPLDNGGYSVQLESEDASLLIGYHGQTISALQLILGLAIQKKSESWVPIVVNVGDYRERREEQLRHLAQTVAQRVRFSGLPQTLTQLSAAERRIVHLTLAGDDMVETISEGEGQDRHLIIRPKQTS
jgi:spoIIIJ-associated protein